MAGLRVDHVLLEEVKFISPFGLHVDHILLEEVKFVSPFVSSKPISHLYEIERPPSPLSEFKPCPSGPMSHIESLEEENLCAMDLPHTSTL